MRDTSEMPSVIESLLIKAIEKKAFREQLANLADGTYQKTSDPTGKYNCIAHAAYDCRKNWWPVGDFAPNDRYWPKGAPPRRTISAFRKAFRLEGFEPCENGDLEPGYEKVVLYVSDEATFENPLNAPTHMARQLPCGNWTSKLGGYIDIQHDSPERLIGKKYGRIELYLKRPRILILPTPQAVNPATSKRVE
jgi:hypothetical protein